MALKHFWYNFTLEHIFFIKLAYNWWLIGKNTSDGKTKNSVKIDKLIRFKTLIINNPTVKDWYLYADKTDLCWYCTYFFLMYKKKKTK